MSRIEPLRTDEESAPQKALLEPIRTSQGDVPNFLRVLAHSPAALRSYLQQSEALRNGVLGSTLGEQLAVAVSGANGSDYCASAHSMLAERCGVSGDELARNLHGEAGDRRTAAVLGFARLVVANRGFVQDEDLSAVREAGVSTAETVEILAHICLSLLTNYLNQIAQTKVDFPSVSTREARINA